ncbi:hypothetical protein B0A49_02593 [Cryomyces minteri]|uniref:Uncharacterized protein n=1 Tax=Cryomyces minteri TaxID=331657 RepID=A0A4U0XHR5_9PEZI|nr:hypothetical protein B0A49_02593 [Cryomyces minteri]
MAPVGPIEASIRGLVGPSHVHFALALAVVRSKPDDVSIRGECFHHCHEDPIIQQTTIAQNIGTWTAQPTGRLSTRGLRSLVSKSQRDAPSEDVISDLKRKKSASVAVGDGACRPAKRPKLSEDLAITVGDHWPRDSFVEDFESLEIAIGGRKIVQDLYSLHKLYQQWSPDAGALAYHLIQASSAVTSVISSACKRHHSRVGPGAATSVKEKRKPLKVSSAQVEHDEGLNAVFRAAARAFTSLLHGLAQLGAASGSNKFQGSVMYSYVKMFAGVLDCIADAALVRAQQDIDHQPAASSTKSKSKLQKTIKELQVPRAIVHFLMAIISTLNAKSAVHRDLFEGLMFILLDRLGNRLYSFTFDHERGATIDSEIVASIISTEGDPHKLLDTQARKIEAPFLIQVFERAMAAAPQFLGSQASFRTSKNAPATSKSSTIRGSGSSGKASLTLPAKNRLQQTLVNGIFGSEGAEHEEFMDCLRMPARSGPMPQQPKREKTSVPEWFQEELWKLLGWEILAREGEW